ncbi:hypothetical protein L1049_009334 [Liquidambar formosana]|uniref:AAA+ ATPase domain-containing protein n=1 Tax=Liquidambar formosana TaxID=63359 RepID=A0AAP0X530_LIQFO
MLFAVFLFSSVVSFFFLWKIGESFFNSIVEKARKYLEALVWEQVGYLIHYHSNMETLKQEVKKLNDIKKDVEHLVDEALNNGQHIGDGVNGWLKTVDWINKDVNRLEDEATVNRSWLNGWCPNLISRYSLSKEAINKTQEVIGLQEDDMTGLNFADFEHFESRIRIMDEIMAALKDDKINAIGICGLGGVGKTTMAKKVGKRAKAEKLFDETVMTVVTLNPDPEKIQAEIAKRLDLEFKGKDDFPERAKKLQKKLMGGKRHLIILDDVWKVLDLKEIGIPFGGVYMGCKVMLISRSQEVCKSMKFFTIEMLLEPEAWNLFVKSAGNSIKDSPNLHKIAKKVVKECGGLPLAIITVGRALNGSEQYAWEDALLQLKMSIPENISEMTQKVYRCIELSYNFLDSPEAKSCLLLCCLFEEDTNIWFEDLFKYGLGLGLFKGIDALAEARKRVRTLVDKLKSCYLLLDGEWKESFKVHDVVRDVIRFKVTEGKEVFLFGEGQRWTTNQKYSSLSLKSNLNTIHERPEQLPCPKLDLLLLEGMDDPLEEVDDFFEGMEGLKVLGLRRMFIPSSRTPLSSLKNLRTLCLPYCHLEDVSLIGQLKALVILSFRYSYIEELPPEIGNLTRLKLLDLTRCGKLKRISSGVISRLIQLEELYLRRSGLRWVVGEEGKEEYEVNLKELRSLPNLIALQTLLPTAKFPGSNFLFKNLKRFDISITAGEGWNWSYPFEFWNELELDLDARVLVGSGINELLKKTEALRLKLKGVKKVLHDPTLSSLVRLKTLKIYSFEGAEYLFDTVDLNSHSICPVLESVEINDVDNLKMICHGQLPAGSFRELRYLELFNLSELLHLWKDPNQLVSLRNLREIVVNRCKRLENLFSQSIAEGLVQLHSLIVRSCEMIEEIVATERGEHGEANKIRFPTLSDLRLVGLPSLISFCKKMDEIEFPQLRNLSIVSLPKIRTLSPNSLASEGEHEIATQYLFDKKVVERFRLVFFSLGNLRRIEVNKCNRLENLFSRSIAEGLVQLHSLRVRSCEMIEEIVAKERGEHGEATNKIRFPKLVDLRLMELPSLISFCKKMDEIEFPQLSNLCLKGLPKLKTFFLNSLASKGEHDTATQYPFNEKVAFQNLKSIEVHRCDSLRKLFYLPMARGLLNLELICIKHCKMMEEIVVKGENEEEDRTNPIVIPQLKSLILCGLPNLTSFSQGLYAFDFPLLKEMDIYDCLEMKTSSCKFLSTPKLEKVEGGYQLLWVGGHNNTIQVFARKKDSSPGIKVFKLWHNDNVECIVHSQLSAMSLCEIREICVQWCNKLLNVPLHLLQRFGNLEELTIEYCASLVEVFEGEGLNIEESDIVLPSKLKHLVLDGLPELKHILKREPKRISFLQSLRVVHIQNCNRLRNLFSTSMAKSAEQLQDLVIVNCELMEEIVIKGENEEEYYRTDKIIMPHLKSLRLSYLPNLTSFCQGLYAFDLPLLEDVTIDHCLKMKTFTFGNLSTPKLEEVKGHCLLFWMGDLNDAIQAFAQKELEANQEIGQQEHFDDDGNDEDDDNAIDLNT